MLTFSTPPTESTLLTSLSGILSELPDNTSKLITPKNLRDSSYTIWENIIFKPTKVSSSQVSYIGVDQDQLTNYDQTSWYPKVYFGAKQISGQYIMDSNLIEHSDSDYYFYNFGSNPNSTKMSILSGTGPFFINGSLAAPYFESYVVSLPPYGNVMTLGIKNESYVTDGSGTYYGGDITIRSEYGNISLNDVIFPKVSNANSSNDGYVLRYKWISGQAYAVWESAYTQSLTTLSSSGQITISGNPVVISGYAFSDQNIVATAIGGIKAGETFSNVDVLDMIRRIIYTYVAPRTNTYFTFDTDPYTYLTTIESGDTRSSSGNILINWSLTTNSTYSISTLGWINAPNYTTRSRDFPSPGSVPNIGNTYGYYQVTESTNVTNPLPYKPITFTLSVSDIYPNTIASAATLYSVLPHYYGTSTQSISYIGNILGTTSYASSTGYLTPILPKPIIGSPTQSDNKDLTISTIGLGPGDGSGYIYFGYPSYYPPLVSILDGNGFEIIGSFNTYSISLSSPNSWWSGKNYIFYATTYSTTVPYTSSSWKFKYVI